MMAMYCLSKQLLVGVPCPGQDVTWIVSSRAVAEHITSSQTSQHAYGLCVQGCAQGHIQNTTGPEEAIQQ